MVDDKNDLEDLKNGFGKLLNAHGHAFQYAVLEKIGKLHRDVGWAFHISEFPVSVNERSTHVDFILKKGSEGFYLVCECKRPDPAISNWCFAKAPYTSRINRGQDVVREEFYVEKSESNQFSELKFELQMKLGLDLDTYDLGFEVKGDSKGEGLKGRGELDGAISQVLRGTNGFVEFMMERIDTRNPKLYGADWSERQVFRVLPVIFTTARLFTSDAELNLANIGDGKLDISETELKEVPWVLLNYPQSPDLKHQYQARGESHGLSEILYFEYVRTIAIVSPSGIEGFFNSGILGTNYWEAENRFSGTVPRNG